VIFCIHLESLNAMIISLVIMLPSLEMVLVLWCPSKILAHYQDLKLCPKLCPLKRWYQQMCL